MAGKKLAEKLRTQQMETLAVDRRAAARLLGVSESLLRKQYTTRDPAAIPFFRIGRRVLIRIEDIRSHIARRVSVPADEPKEKRK